MAMSERKIKILQAIINDYIVTAEPVGSRTIAKKYNLGISSATIRNEMSDLEEMGLIRQPHASSGRIPSDLGYRLYVDQLMQQRVLLEEEENFLRNVVSRNISRIDYLMEETAKALSHLTNYTTIISEPMLKETKLKQIRLLPLDRDSLMLVIATEGNFIKNYVIPTECCFSEERIYELGLHINQVLQGHSFGEIDGGKIAKLQSQLAGCGDMLQSILNAVEETVRSVQNVQVHLSGTKNILAFPEFSDVEKAKSLFQSLEEKDLLMSLVEEGKENGLQILIGSENNVQSLQDCSIITTSYKLGDNTQGIIGILGPTRMDYSQVVSVLNSMVESIESMIQSVVKEKDDG